MSRKSDSPAGRDRNPFDCIFQASAIEEESFSSVEEVHTRAILPIQNKADVDLGKAFAEHHAEAFKQNSAIRRDVLSRLIRRVEPEQP